MKRILLIEDDQLDVSIIKRALTKLIIQPVVEVARNGVEALAILNGNYAHHSKVLPDIILLDINMPEMSGLEFLGIIKNYYSLQAIKIFVMISSAEEYDIVAAQQFGVAGYVLKPLDFNVTKEDRFSAGALLLKKELAGESQKRFRSLFFPVIKYTGTAKVVKAKGVLSGWPLAGVKAVAIGLATCGVVEGVLQNKHEAPAAKHAAAKLTAPIRVFQPASVSERPRTVEHNAKKVHGPVYPKTAVTPVRLDSTVKMPRSLKIIVEKIEDGEAYTGDSSKTGLTN